MNNKRDVVLTVNVVEEPLVRAVHLLSKKLNKKLKPIVLVNSSYAEYENRPKDHTGYFQEIVCDFDNPRDIQRKLRPYSERILLATCRYEEAIQHFAKIIPFLPYIKTPTETSLLWATEKPLMREKLWIYDEKLVPRFQYLEETDMANLKKLTKNFSFPVIIKPSGLAKALFVTKCDNYHQLKKELSRTFQRIAHAYSKEHYPGKPSVLVEEMIQGDMYSIDAYVTDLGKIYFLPTVRVFTAHSKGLEGFYGYEQFLPSSLAQKEEKLAQEASRSAIRALNLRSTTVHIELFKTKSGWKIIELAARIGGFRNQLYKEVYGVEHFLNDLLLRMGEEPKISSKPRKHAAAMKIYPEKEGVIKSITGLERVNKIESLAHFNKVLDIDEYAFSAVNGGDPIIEAILSNESLSKLKKDMTKLRSIIGIEIDELRDINPKINI